MVRHTVFPLTRFYDKDVLTKDMIKKMNHKNNRKKPGTKRLTAVQKKKQMNRYIRTGLIILSVLLAVLLIWRFIGR